MLGSTKIKCTSEGLGAPGAHDEIELVRRDVGDADLRGEGEPPGQGDRWGRDPSGEQNGGVIQFLTNTVGRGPLFHFF